MLKNLPTIHTVVVQKYFHKGIKSTQSSALSKSESLWSFTTLFLSIIALLLIIFSGNSEVGKLISPIFAPLQTLHEIIDAKQQQETFAFIPGWSRNKFDDVSFEGISTIAFFDVPVSEDGSLNRDTVGYEAFRSDDAADLFARADAHGVKTALTLTQVSNIELLHLLDSSSAQDVLASEVVAEMQETGIDGIVFNFEYNGQFGTTYREAFSEFIRRTSEKIHAQVPGAQVSIALTDTLLTEPLYDTKHITESVDKVFIIANNFALPERVQATSIAPVFGYSEESYWKDVDAAVNEIAEQVDSKKIVLETAWYGNGDNYPFYQSSVSPNNNADVVFVSNNTMQTPLSESNIERLVAQVPSDARPAALRNLPMIAQALEAEGILNANVLAYALATIEHETAGTFEPIEEIKGRRSARRLGYEGGANYFGRGFIQLTHLRNYRTVGKRINMGEQLVRNPELAGDPKVAAKVLAAFFKDNGIATLATNGRFIQARKPVNPDDWAWFIASAAWRYLEMIA
jgi:predicted chitinase